MEKIYVFIFTKSLQKNVKPDKQVTIEEALPVMLAGHLNRCVRVHQ